MQRRIGTGGLAVVLILLGVLGAIRPAAAQTGGLPTVVQPPSARFDITSNVKVSTTGGSAAIGDLELKSVGTGAQSGNNYQEDITSSITLPDFPGLSDPSAPSEPITTTTSAIVVDGKYYFRMISGLGSSGGDQWYEMDQSTLPGGGANMTNPLGNMIGLDPAMAAQYAGALTVQPVGKETISGGATTKYQVDVDLPKLYAAMGVTQTADITQIIQNSKMVLYMWVGDADSYLYQLQTTLTSQTTDSTTQATTSLALDMLITYRDFGAAITITAPPNAVPFPAVGGTGGGATLPGISAGIPGMASIAPLPGMPSVMPGMPVTEPPVIAPPAVSPVPGMPRSGNADPAGTLALLALGLGCLGGGVWTRRAARQGR